MSTLGKLLMFTGALIFLGGFLLWAGKSFGFGQLPGDFIIKKGKFTFYFPLVSFLLLSLILSLLLNLFLRR